MIDTRGMNYSNYDPNNDPDGSIGIYLASRLDTSRKRRQEDEAVEKRMDNLERGLPPEGRPRRGSKIYYENVARIALRKFPAVLPDEHEASPTEIRERLGQLRKMGYTVPKYSKMKAWKLRKTLREIRRKTAEDARMHCPGLLEEISREHDEAIQREHRDR